MPGSTPTTPVLRPLADPIAETCAEQGLGIGRERAGGRSRRDGNEREPAGNRVRASRRMHLPLLTSLSGGRSAPVPADQWAGLVEAALAGDEEAVQSRLRCGGPLGEPADPPTLVASRRRSPRSSPCCGTPCTPVPVDSDGWRTLVRRRLARRQYRPTPEVATPREILEDTVPGGEFEAAVLDQLDARRTLRTLGPMPAGMGPYLAAVWADQPPAPAAAHCARQYRYLRRRAVA